MSYSKADKIKVLELLARGKRVEEIMSTTNISRTSIFRWKSQNDSQNETPNFKALEIRMQNLETRISALEGKFLAVVI